jgi:ribose transport system permease protein
MKTHTHADTVSIWSRLFHSQEFGVFIPLLIIIVVTGAFNPDFLKINNFSTILKIIPFIAIVSLGESFVLMTGNVDISVGRASGFAGIFFAYLMIVARFHWIPAMLIVLATGALIGFVNGFLVVKVGIADFIATIGSLYMVGGARFLLTKGYPLSPLPSNLGGFGDAVPLGLSWPLWIAVALFAGVHFMNKKTIYGRSLLASGDNREVAVLAGINVTAMRLSAYTICGFMAAVAGILFTIDLNNGVPQNGDGWEFRAIASCAVGGVSLAGGKGSALGTAIGVLIIYILSNSLIMLSVPPTLQKSVIGILLAGSVMLDVWKQKRKIKA